MIIGISGKAQAGKDTTGKIIQHYLTRPDMALSSFELLSELEQEQTWKIKRFATKVKQFLSILTGIPLKDFEKESVKNSYLGDEWKVKWLYNEKGRTATMDRQNAYPHIPFSSITVREALQIIGTDLFRDRFHPNTWVNALMVDYGIDDLQYFKAYPDNYNLPNWIITDCRFPNEANAIKDRDGIVLRINRPIKVEGMYEKDKAGFDVLNYTVNRPISMHESELALDDYKFDYIIENNGTIQDLINNVKKFTDEKIIKEMV